MLSSDSLWVVTSYYNPAGYRRRLENFHAFRRNLKAPLLAVELAKPGAHQLRDGDADMLVTLTGEDRLWQKERLINIGVGRLPDHVRYVAWVDCDLIFSNPDWPAEAKARLDADGGLVQLFDVVAHLPREAEPRTTTLEACLTTPPLFTGVSVAHAVRNHTFGDDSSRYSKARLLTGTAFLNAIDGQTIYGLGWAVRRDVVEACGLFDKAVVGGADGVQVAAALGRLDDHFRSRQASERHRAAVDGWADSARRAGLLDAVGSLGQTIYHLWHGDIPDRHYWKRHAILARHGYDPDRDLVLAADGTWAWADPRGPLAAEVEAYFFSRFEDGRT